MNLDEYQKKAQVFSVYDEQLAVVYPVTLLNEEAGEVAGKMAKAMRKGMDFNDPSFKQDIAKELGDVLWALSAAALDLGLSLDDIARVNLTKLERRMARGVIVGEGDDR